MARLARRRWRGSLTVERRVKERLVGASILVALIVLIVPELLSGPPSSGVATTPASTAAVPIRNVTVDLEEGASSDTASSASAPASAPASAQQPPAPVAGPVPVPAPPPVLEKASAPPKIEPESEDASPHRWAVQVGSFANRVNAERLTHHLKAHGADAYVSPLGKGAAERFRVRVGPFADRSAAAQAMAKLKAEGEPASLVAP
jgi:DedD protein